MSKRRSRGSVRELPSGSWQIEIPNGVDANGKRKREFAVIDGTRRDAERLRTQMLADLDGGRLAEGRQSLGQFLAEEWLPSVSAVSKKGGPLRPTTIDRYRGTIAHVTRHISDVRLQDLRETHVEKLRDALTAEGTLAPQTISDILRVLGQALNRAQARRYVSVNVAAAHLVNRPVGKKPKFNVISPVVGAAVLDAARGSDPWDIAAHLGLALGLRREELLALTWDDVVDGELFVTKSITYARGECHYGAPKTENSERGILLPEIVLRALKRHKAAQAERLLALGITPTYIVDNGIGEHRIPPSFSKSWSRWATANGFEGVTYHTLRHGQATLLLAGGVSDKVAQSILGHSDAAMTRRYQEVVQDLRVDAAGVIDRLLGDGKG